MASIASPFHNPHSPSPSSKKRTFADGFSSNSHFAPKKVFGYPPNFPSKSFGGILPQSKMATPVTGLENFLAMDQEFVEATEATQNDESKRSILLPKKVSLADTFLRKKQLADEIPSTWGDRVGPRPGLPNVTGALCYRHSLFQALLHIPKFINWLEIYHQPKDCVAPFQRDCISCQLRQLSSYYWDRDYQPRKMKIKSTLREINDIFTHLGWRTDRVSEQGDPDEQLVWMLGVMRHEMTSEAFAYFDAFHDLVLESSITCEKCGHVAKTEDIHERLLSIPIKPRVSSNHIVQYIQAYMNELVHEYRCENESCKHKSDKHRIQKIAYAPDVLMVQLKRFNQAGGKDSQKISFTTKLSLKPHRLHESQGPLDYQLTASICHLGTASFGHYICYAKGPDKKWVEFNDLSTFPVDEDEAYAPPENASPYVLFYERVKPAEAASP